MRWCVAKCSALALLVASSFSGRASDSLHVRASGINLLQTATGFGSITGLYFAWYARYPAQPFTLINDWPGWLQVDKAGHAMTTYTISLQCYDALRWAGRSEEAAMHQAFWPAVGFQCAFEVMDGFSRGWGFSVTDVGANLAGAMAFASQQKAWHEQRFYSKISFSPSPIFDGNNLEVARAKALYGSSVFSQWLKDYNGQTYWLSANVWSLVGKPPWLPRWINACAGYSAEGLLGANSNEWLVDGKLYRSSLKRQRQWVFSLDVDLRRAKLPVWARWLRPLSTTVKIPFPAAVLADGKWTFSPVYF